MSVGKQNTLPLPTESTCDGFLVQSQAQAALHSKWKQEQKEARVKAKMAELNTFFGEVSSDQEEEYEREKKERRRERKKRRVEGGVEKVDRAQSRLGTATAAASNTHGGLGAFFKRSFGKLRRDKQDNGDAQSVSGSSHMHTISSTTSTTSSSSSSDWSHHNGSYRATSNHKQAPSLSLHHNTSIDIDTQTIQKFING